MTVRLPEHLYEQLRREAFEKHVSQASIIIEALTAHFGPETVTVPTAVPGSSPQFQQGLQRAVQEAVERYGQLNPNNGVDRKGTRGVSDGN